MSDIAYSPQSPAAKASARAAAPAASIWERLERQRSQGLARRNDQERADATEIDARYATLCEAGQRLLRRVDYAALATFLRSGRADAGFLDEGRRYWGQAWLLRALVLASALIAMHGAPIVLQLAAAVGLLFLLARIVGALENAHWQRRVIEVYDVELYALYDWWAGEGEALQLAPGMSARQARGVSLKDAAIGMGDPPYLPLVSIGLRRRSHVTDAAPPFLFVHLAPAGCRLSGSSAERATVLHGGKSADTHVGNVQMVAQDIASRLGALDEPQMPLPDPDRLCEAWSKVALPASTLDALVSQQVLFMMGDPACGSGLLLTGPPGTGKTTLARVFAESSGAELFLLSESDLKQQYQGASAQAVKEVWGRAAGCGKAVIFIDECEGVFGRRGGLESDSTSGEIVRSILPLWDGTPTDARVLVVGATNRTELLDPAIRSRFGTCIEIGLPGATERSAILGAALRGMRLDPACAADPAVAEATAGASGRDLQEIARRVRRDRVGVEDTPLTPESLLKVISTFRGQKRQRTSTSASWTATFVDPQVSEALQDVAYALAHAEELREQGYPMPRGVLLYGPAGTGKTQLARTLANEAKCHFIVAATADLKAGFNGQSGQKVKQLFADARANAPCVLFLDEIDAVAGDRNGQSDAFSTEILTQMLQELDGVVDHSDAPIVVLAATNRPDAVDAALLSRFQRKLLVDLPNAAQREGLAAHLIAHLPFSESAAVKLREHAAAQDGWSHRDVANLVERVTSQALREARKRGAATSLQICDVHVDAAAMSAGAPQ